jgi:imidazolonepropionase-like amidohydrolase
VRAYLVPTLVTYFVLDEIGAAFGLPGESQKKLKDVMQAGLSSLEIAKAAGVRMGFGTDLLGELHDQQSREFRIRREVLSPAEILRSATVVNAEILRADGELGVVREGAKADLLVVDGNPLEDITVLEDGSRLHAVVQGGRIAVDRGL